MLTFTALSENEMRALAAHLGAALHPGDVLLLYGNLGAGKTTFTQGLAAGMGMTTPIHSPTFTLVQEYPSPPFPLFHFDFYRLSSPEEIVDLGFEEYLEREGVTVVEWAERLDWLTPPEYLEIRLERAGEETRTITLIPHGARYMQRLEQLPITTKDSLPASTPPPQFHAVE